MFLFVRNLLETAKNSPFAIWTNLYRQLFRAEIPQYTKYSEISARQFDGKSLAQIIKKELLTVYNRTGVRKSLFFNRKSKKRAEKY